VVVVLGRHSYALGAEVGGVETRPRQTGRSWTHPRLPRWAAPSARLGDGAEVADEIGLRHAGAGVLDGQSVCSSCRELCGCAAPAQRPAWSCPGGCHRPCRCRAREAAAETRGGSYGMLLDGPHGVHCRWNSRRHNQSVATVGVQFRVSPPTELLMPWAVYEELLLGRTDWRCLLLVLLRVLVVRVRRVILR